MAEKRQEKKLSKGKVALIVILVVCVVSGSLAGAVFGIAGKQGTSSTSVFYEAILTVVLTDKSVKTSNKQLEKARKNNLDYEVPSIYKTLYCESVGEANGRQVCYFGNPNSEYTVYYLHGGAFIYQPILFHYDYCKRLAKHLNVRVVMPIYPKAPDNTYVETLAYVSGLYKELLKEKSNDKIIFAGDSAGASMVMSLSQYLYDEGIPQPAALFAFSPCADMSMSNPDIDTVADLDPMLQKEDLIIKMSTYANGTDMTNPYVNPWYCEFDKLPTMNVFAGGHEIFVVDCRRLKERLTGEGIAMNYYEYPYLNHTFSIFPMPESTECMEIIRQTVGMP